jgi:hypothetical protein
MNYFRIAFQGRINLRRYFLLILVLPFLWVSGSNAAEQDEWTYTMIRGDNLWNITERYFDEGFRYWDSLIRLNKVTDPKHMLPGTKVRIPLRWLKSEPAVVEVRDTHGAVNYIEARQTSPRQLIDSTILHKGDQVIVGEGSYVVLEFADTSTLFIGSESRMELLRANKFSNSGLADSKVDLMGGRTESKVHKKSSRFQIKTPSANTAVRGTDFRVAINRDNPAVSQVEVLSGTVGVSGGKSERNIQAGFGTTISQGEAPLPPIQLLAAPEIYTPAAYSRKLPVDIKWQEIKGARGYRVLIREAEGKQTLLIDKVIPIARINTSALEDDKYTIGVRAIDDKGLEGKETVYTFELDARPQPPLAISPQDEETVRTDLPEFEWSSPVGGTGYHFQLSENPELTAPLIDFTDFTRTQYTPEQLAPGTYYWRMATLNKIKEGPFGMMNSFILRPSPEAPEVAAEGDDENITLRWQPGTSGQQYKAQLSADPDFKEIVSEEQLQQAAWSMKRPEQKVYFRVRIIDVDGFEGDWSIAQQIMPPPDPWYYFLAPLVPVAIGLLFL